MTETPECAAVRELIPELAAGVAAGDERARALRHVATCTDCNRELDAAAFVVDELLPLAPAVEPPPGFEVGVLAALNPPRRRWPRLLRLAAAILVAMALGGVGVWQATADDRRVADSYRRTLEAANGRYMTAKTFTAPDGSTAGRIFAYQGAPSWIFITVKYGTTAGPYTVRLSTRDGGFQTLGTITVQSGSGAWGRMIDVPVSRIAQVSLTGADDMPCLSADFGPPRST
ncbi:hypothetical protein Aph01nite_39490 [Acrocarpospora phusangensis]|uniref:Putative zinc-finger domain-containing protein n=1 Tax=Acrocarpospora phusangensis TaxID=1070424 RepID=A0A919UL44_9ACTN|nr:zf-HC2 domain-containing protein [Acrocarpospora phusangensis]GIH25639.1 hypothetical protein Aph01nite_39490 [Acrocarpospora phusangensis]